MNSIKRLENELLSMFDDPLVDSYLQKSYGFEPVKFYIDEIIPDMINSLKNAGDARDEFERFRYGVIYAMRSLQWDYIKDTNSKRKWEEVKASYNRVRHASVTIGEDLYSMANSIGYATQIDQKLLLNEIFKKYTINKDGTKMCNYIRVKQ